MGKKDKLFCGQTVVPSVDNGLDECSEFVNAKCVIYKDSIPFLGISPTSSIEDIIEAIVIKFKDNYIDYKNLEKIIRDLSLDIFNNGNIINEIFTLDDTESLGNNVFKTIFLHNADSVLLVSFDNKVLDRQSFTLNTNDNSLIISLDSNIFNVQGYKTAQVIYKYKTV